MSAVAKRGMSEEERRQRTQARVGLASNFVGLAAGGAATVGALRNPALRRPRTAEAGPVTGRILGTAGRRTGRLARAVRTPRGRAALVAGGAGSALGLQLANLGGDVVANRVLSRESGVAKREMRDDAFLRDYRVRISPAAEHGYNTLRRLRNRERAEAAGSAAGVASLGGFAALMARHGARPTPLGAALLAAPAVAGTYMAGRSAADSGRMQNRMDKIKRKAYQREDAGTYGVGRRRPKVEKSIEQSVVSKSIEVRVTGHGVNIAKRNFDAEADRQRRLGLYAGAGIGGGVVAGDAARRMVGVERLSDHYTDLPAQFARKRVYKLPAGRAGRAKLAALAAGSVLGVGGGVAAYRRGVSERNNPWR